MQDQLKLLEALRAAFRAARDAGTALAGGAELTIDEALDAVEALRAAADAVEAAFITCECGRGPIVGGPVDVCLECELEPFGRAWQDEQWERLGQAAY